MLTTVTYLHAWLVHACFAGAPTRAHGDRGQTTAEYALVILGAAAVAVLILSWATKTNLVGTLFDFVLDKVMGSAG